MSDTTNRGRFRRGNPGGPGRPRKLIEESLSELFEEIDFPRRSPPPLPSDPDDFWQKFDYDNRRSEFLIYGVWTDTVSVPVRLKPRLLELFELGRMQNRGFTISDAFEELQREISAEDSRRQKKKGSGG